MRRGCISLGNINCDDCHRTTNYLEQYLLTDEAEGILLCLCVDCALNRGYAHHKQEKGEWVITFFPE